MTSVTILHHIGLLPMYIRHLYIRTRKMSFNQNKQTIVKSLTFPNASLHLNHCPPPKRGKKRNSPSGHFSRHPEISISQPLSLSTHNTFGDLQFSPIQDCSQCARVACFNTLLKLHSYVSKVSNICLALNETIQSNLFCRVHSANKKEKKFNKNT